MILLGYSNEELKVFRNVVDAKFQEVSREYNAVLWQLNQIPEDENDASENGFVRKDLLYIQAARLKRHLDNLRSAMLRIENKTYGICIVSGTLIPKQRLLAVPHTTVNTEAKLYPLRAGA
jgi:RNA polymerase-binding transcription factor DksA